MQRAPTSDDSETLAFGSDVELVDVVDAVAARRGRRGIFALAGVAAAGLVIAAASGIRPRAAVVRAASTPSAELVGLDASSGDGERSGEKEDGDGGEGGDENDGSCSGSGVDPYVTGRFIDCCPGNVKCLKQWKDHRWFWRCYPPDSQESRSANKCDAPSPVPAPAPPDDGAYHPHFDTTPDYLDIAKHAKGVSGNDGELSDNYYLVVGDWGGCSGGCDGCCGRQWKVANLLRDYVRNRKSNNPNSQLLFVLAVGDNFYWTGASSGRFKATWLDVYGPELTDVPWFAVMGNHDYGNNDPGCGCPNKSPRFKCDDSSKNATACGGPKPYSTAYQGYDSNALNADKGGVDGDLRKNFQAPDYTFYYTIPELDWELVAMDWNVMDFEGLGGDGPTKSASKLTAHCGSQDALYKSLNAIKDASTKILVELASKAEFKNVAIIGHYPAWAQGNTDFREMYLSHMPEERKPDTKVYNFFGHTHNQMCFTMKDGECVSFLTGGAGGCCGSGDLPGGFVSISWDDGKKQKVECFAPDSRCTVSMYCDWHCGAEVEPDICPNTIDDPSCAGYTGPPLGANATTASKWKAAEQKRPTAAVE